MRRVQFLTMVTILLMAGCGAPPDGSQRGVAGQNDPDSTSARSDTFVETRPSTDTGSSTEAQAPGDRQRREGESNVTVDNTGDIAVWPAFDLPPMVIEFDLPDVPEQIKGPFTEKDLPAVE